MKDVDAAWLAGLIDGEGSFTFAIESGNPTPRLQIGMIDPEAIEKAQAIVGFGTPRWDKQKNDPTRKRNAPCLRWVVMGSRVSPLVVAVYPYLTVKKRQAMVAWNLAQLIGPRHFGRRRVDPANLARRFELVQVLRDLNARREPTLPAWIGEPMLPAELLVAA